MVVCVAANMQFESQWNQEVAQEKDKQLIHQVSTTENQQGIPNDTHTHKKSKLDTLTLMR